MPTNVQDKVIGILATQALLEPSQVDPKASLEALGLDSLGLVEIIFAIEEEFDVDVPYNANEPDNSGIDTSSVSAVVAGVERLISEKAV